MTDTAITKDPVSQDLEGKYRDREDTEQILESLKTAKNMADVHAIVADTYPSWILGFLKGFCPNYPHLTQNWERVCSEIGVPKAEVMIVEFVSADDDHKLIRAFAECFTRAGFAVRSHADYVPCRSTGMAVPRERLWNVFRNMEELRDKVPSEYIYPPEFLPPSERLRIYGY